jgi:hypothetical protein
MFIWAYPTIHVSISIYAFRCHILNLMKGGKFWKKEKRNGNKKNKFKNKGKN